MNEKQTPIAVKLLFPLLIAVFCGSIIFLLSIRPYEKVKTYLQVAFMDHNTVIPTSNGIAGLNIVQTDIDTEYSGDVATAGEPVYPEYGTQYAVIECETVDIFAPVYWAAVRICSNAALAIRHPRSLPAVRATPSSAHT